MRKPLFFGFISHLLRNKGHPICEECQGVDGWMASSAGFRLSSGWVSFALILRLAAKGKEGTGQSIKQVYFRPLFSR